MPAVYRSRRLSRPRSLRTTRPTRSARRPAAQSQSTPSLQGTVVLPGRIGQLELTVDVDIAASETSLDAWTIDAAGTRDQVTRDPDLSWIFDQFADATFDLVTELARRTIRPAETHHPRTA